MDIDTPIERPRTEAEWHDAVERNRLKLLRLVCGLLVLARWVFPFASKAAMVGAPLASLSLFQRLAVSLILGTLWKAELATHYLVFVVASLRRNERHSGAAKLNPESRAVHIAGRYLSLPIPSCLSSALDSGSHKCVRNDGVDVLGMFARLTALKEALEDLVGAAESFLLPLREKVFLSDCSSAKRDEGFPFFSVQSPHPSAQRDGAFASTFSHIGEKGRTLFLIPP